MADDMIDAVHILQRVDNVLSLCTTTQSLFLKKLAISRYYSINKTYVLQTYRQTDRLDGNMEV